MHLDLGEGASNVRDLSSASPGVARGALVRADHLCYLRPAGWAMLRAHGVRTVVDLRNDDERDRDLPRPDDLVTVRVALDGFDEAWWAPWTSGPQFGTPLYYRAHVEAFPERLASALVAIAEAPPGGVAFHCMAGRDRTGMVAATLLRLLDTPVDAIVADYLQSLPNLAAKHARMGVPDPGVEIDAYLTSRGLTLAGVLADFVTWPELPARLAAGGFDAEHLAALKARVRPSG
jgi:protein-tyrosine phosphatase